MVSRQGHVASSHAAPCQDRILARPIQTNFSPRLQEQTSTTLYILYMARKYTTVEEAKEAQRRRQNKRRNNGDDIVRPRGRPLKYRTKDEALAAKLENQRLWRQRNREEVLMGNGEHLDLATSESQPKRRFRKYANAEEARLSKNTKARENYHSTRHAATSLEGVAGSSQDQQQDETYNKHMKEDKRHEGCIQEQNFSKANTKRN